MASIYEVRKLYIHRDGVHVDSRRLHDTSPVEADYRPGGFGVYWNNNGQWVWLSDHAHVWQAVARLRELQGADDDEPGGYKPEGAVLYDGTPGSGSLK